VLQQYAIHSTCFARYKARKLYPLLIEGELGIITAHCTAHGDLMAIVNFPTHGTLEIPAELTFIHPLEARENWTSTGPGFTLGDKITTLEGPAIFGVEGMSQLFYIWKDKQTIQGLCQVCIWKDKQNQGKSFVLEPKTSKL
jgi:hypothetical protein